MLPGSSDDFWLIAHGTHYSPSCRSYFSVRKAARQILVGKNSVLRHFFLK